MAENLCLIEKLSFLTQIESKEIDMFQYLEELVKETVKTLQATFRSKVNAGDFSTLPPSLNVLVHLLSELKEIFFE